MFSVLSTNICIGFFFVVVYTRCVSSRVFAYISDFGAWPCVPFRRFISLFRISLSTIFARDARSRSAGSYRPDDLCQCLGAVTEWETPNVASRLLAKFVSTSHRRTFAITRLLGSRVSYLAFSSNRSRIPARIRTNEGTEGRLWRHFLSSLSLTRLLRYSIALRVFRVFSRSVSVERTARTSCGA